MTVYSIHCGLAFILVSAHPDSCDRHNPRLFSALFVGWLAFSPVYQNVYTQILHNHQRPLFFPSPRCSDVKQDSPPLRLTIVNHTPSGHHDQLRVPLKTWKWAGPVSTGISKVFVCLQPFDTQRFWNKTDFGNKRWFHYYQKVML